MKILPFRNGNAYGWSRLRSLFDFFFPIAVNGKYHFIRAEAMSTSDGYREFYTFRAFFWHYFWGFINSFREYKLSFIKLADRLSIDREYAFQVGAIALDVATSLATEGTTSPITWTHVVTGSNPLIAICTGLVDPTTSPQSASVTYNSVAATKARADAGATDSESAVWLLGNPATGSNTVSVSITNNDAAGDYGGVSISYTGCQSSSAADAVNGINGTTTGAKSFNVTTVADNCWVVASGVTWINAAGTSTLTATQTSRGTVAFSANRIGVMRAEDTNAVVHPAGAQAMGFTVGGTGTLKNWAMTGASFAPAAAAGGSAPPGWPILNLDHWMGPRYT